MEKNNTQEEIKDFQKGYLTLPFDGDNLKDFITSLLGTPQTIRKRIKGVFEIHLKDLQNFHDLIEQRIHQQNKGQLIQLTSEIYFADDSSVVLNGYEQLVAYNEVKPLISEAVRMTWSYLIQFPHKKIPEKQEIELMIISTPQRDLIEYSGIPVRFHILGQFKINIEHTDRTWGNDIETLISHQVNSINKPRSKWKKYCAKKSNTIGLSVGLLFLIASLIGIYYRTGTFNISEIHKVEEFSKSTSIVSQKADYILKYLAINSQNLFFLKSQLFIVTSFLVSIILGAWISSLANIKEKSFLILTRKSKENRDQQVKKSQKKIKLFIFSMAVSIAVGVISNYIFGMMTGTL